MLGLGSTQVWGGAGGGNKPLSGTEGMEKSPTRPRGLAWGLALTDSWFDPAGSLLENPTSLLASSPDPYCCLQLGLPCVPVSSWSPKPGVA